MNDEQKVQATATRSFFLVTGLVLLAFFIVVPVMAKVPACDTQTLANSSYRPDSCTAAQWSAYWNKTKEFPRNSDNRRVFSQEDVNTIISYYDLIIEGFTPNDEELQEVIIKVMTILDRVEECCSWIVTEYLKVEFDANSVFPGGGETDNDDIDGVMFLGNTATALNWAFVDKVCDMPICPSGRGADRIVRLLDGGAKEDSKDSYFVEDGFRVTGWTDNWDYTSFGLWAQDSFWGFWQGSESDDLRGLPPTLFIAGGRNPAKPTIGTATWIGLAVGKHKLFPDVRVGRSEITVNLDASELDVIITGLVFGSTTVFSGQVTGHVEVGTALSWKGLPLHDNGSFNEPRKYGVVDSLDDVFATVIPVGGENYSDTAYTIKGQFYGENGDEVTGVFNKNDIEGSFGAYRD